MTDRISRDRLYIDGVWAPSTSDGQIEVVNPTTELVMGEVPAGSAEDVDRCVVSARGAFREWSERPAAERAQLCERLADTFDLAQPRLADLVAREVGTALAIAQTMQTVPVSILLRQYAQVARTYLWDRTVANSVVVREPIGVVGAITPWNYPLGLAASKLAPALASGCTVVLKPSELAPLSVFALVDLIDEVGFPPGVVNLVSGYGDPVGTRLVEHPDVDMISFTGSVDVGRRVAAGAAGTIKRVSLELGGKSAAVFLPDADLEGAVPAALGQVLLNSGQTCLAWSRWLVPRSAQDAVVDLIKATLPAFQVGDPFGGAMVGPVISAAHRERLRAVIDGGIADGAHLVAGGSDHPEGLEGGYFIQPTVFSDVSNNSDLARQEAFGPVLSLIPYDNVDEAVTIANDSDFGLHGAVFGRDEERAVAVARRIRTGQVDINGLRFNPMAPFGGYRQSGNGRELGIEGFESFLETKAIQVS